MPGKEKESPELSYENETWMANMKNLFDQLVKGQNQDRVHFDASVSSAQTLSTQILQNAIESANMISKQAIRHGDIAIDRQWNIDEVARYIVSTEPYNEAVKAAAAAAVNEALAKK